MFASIPTLEQRQGILGKPIQNPLTGEIYANGVIPSSAITPFAKQVLADLPTPTLPGIANNFDSLPRREDFNDKFDVKFDHQFSTRMTAFGRVSHRKAGQLRAAADPRRDRQPEQRVRARAQPAGRRRLHLHADRELAARVAPRLCRAPKPARNLPASAGRRCSTLYGITGLPTDPRFAGGLTEQGVTGWTTWGRQNSNPQFQDPSVFNPRINFSWVRGRQSFKTGYEYQAINTQIDDFNPKYGRDIVRRAVQPPRRRDGGRPGDLQPGRLHVRRRAAPTRSSTRSSRTSASGCTSATCRTTSRWTRG